MKPLSLIVLLLVNTITLSAQQSDGYWDKDRASIRDIKLCAGCRTWYRIDFPVGTTEVAYRITLLENNQKLASSFADLLGSIPSATTQTASAGVTLLSAISGDDKCRYYLFGSEEAANQYHHQMNYSQACYFNSNPINKEVNFLRTNCITDKLEYLFFAFQSTNEVLSERIVLEVVPWVDNRSSRGWTKEVKDNFIEACVTQLTEATKREEVCQCILDKFQEKYKLQDFNKFGQQELEKISTIAGEECLKETGEQDNLLDKQRNEALSLYNEGKYGEAIGKLLEIINTQQATTLDYNNIGYFYILTKQYLKAIKYLKQGELLDESELLIKGNLAHAYLFNGDLDKAKDIYARYKSHNISEDKSWVEMVNEDFSIFREKGLPSDQFEAIQALLK